MENETATTPPMEPMEPKGQLVKSDTRYVMFPIEHRDLWNDYKNQEASFWTAEEIDFTVDVKHYRDKLNDGERWMLCVVLGFFASSDTIVAQNIDTNFIGECDKLGLLEAKVAYNFQTAMENIHSEAYSEMIQQLLPTSSERAKLFNFIHTVDAIKAKAELCLRWMGTSDGFDRLPEALQSGLQETAAAAEAAGLTLPPAVAQWMRDAQNAPTFGERLIAFICVEAIFFSTSFAVIFWFKKRGLLPGICFANELINKDEGMHQMFGVTMVCKLRELGVDVPTPERIWEIVSSFVELEKVFVCEALKTSLVGINSDKMCRYAEFIGDRVLVDLGCERRYFSFTGGSTKCPCEWMESLSLHHVTNFFERRVASYQRRGVKQIENAAELNTYRTDVDF